MVDLPRLCLAAAPLQSLHPSCGSERSAFRRQLPAQSMAASHRDELPGWLIGTWQIDSLMPCRRGKREIAPHLSYTSPSNDLAHKVDPISRSMSGFDWDTARWPPRSGTIHSHSARTRYSRHGGWKSAIDLPVWTQILVTRGPAAYVLHVGTLTGAKHLVRQSGAAVSHAARPVIRLADRESHRAGGSQAPARSGTKLE